MLNLKTGPFTTVMVLGGSEGGLREEQAKLLANRGFAALALAYFGMEGLPPAFWKFRWSTLRKH